MERTLNNLDQAIQSALGGISEFLAGQGKAQQYRRALDWLSPPDPWNNHNYACRKRHLGTCSWLLESDSYVRWKTSCNDTLWFSGKVGCGKTILCSSVIEDIRRDCEQDLNTRLAFFYFTRSDAEKQSYNGVLLSLVSQLSQSQTSSERLREAYEKHYPRKPSNKILESLLWESLQESGQTVIILDALNETHNNDEGRQAIVDWLKKIKQAGFSCKVFVTSQELIDIRMSMSSLGARHMVADPGLIDFDIRQYVASELKEHMVLRRLSSDLKAMIQKEIEEKSDGMFLLVESHLEELRRLKFTGPFYVERALQLPPKHLEETYEQMLLNIDVAFRSEARCALRWLAFSTEPLKLGELSEVCLISPTKEPSYYPEKRGALEDVLDVLGGLVIVESSSSDSKSVSKEGLDTALVEGSSQISTDRSLMSLVHPDSKVRLAHLSVKDYLVSGCISNDKAAEFELEYTPDLYQMGRICVAYLIYYSRSPAKTLSDQDFETFPLLRYAAEQWTKFMYMEDSNSEDFVRDVSLDSVREPGKRPEIQLLTSDQYRRDWLMAYNPEHPFHAPWDEDDMVRCNSGLYYAVSEGLRYASRELLWLGSDPNTAGGHYGNALQVAAFNGNEDLVLMLITCGAKVNAQGGELGTALQAASSEGHVEIVGLLIDKGAEVNAQGGDFGNALLAASYGGHEKVIELLLNKGAEANAPGAKFVPRERNGHGGYYGTALHAASSKGYETIVELLLHYGAEVNGLRGHYGTALQAASHGGHEKIVKLLLNNGAEPNAQGGHYYTALQAASSQGRMEIVKLLLRVGAVVNVQGGDYGTALQAASCYGHIDVAKLLLEEGAEVNVQAGSYGTALIAASWRGRAEAVQLLLDNGADVNLRAPGKDGNALQIATRFGHKEVEALLLQHGATRTEK